MPTLQRWHRRRLAARVDLTFLSKRSPGAIAPDFSDLWFLYKAVRSKRPRVALEFGSGCSTVVLAQALYDVNQQEPRHRGRLYSIDSQAYWAEVTTSTMPAHLHEMCEVIWSPALPVEHEGTPCWRHATLPDVVPDLIYLDGPPLTRDRLIAIDILDLESKLPQDCLIIIDGRKHNTEYLRSQLARPYQFKHRHLFRNSVISLSRR